MLWGEGWRGCGWRRDDGTCWIREGEEEREGEERMPDRGRKRRVDRIEEEGEECRIGKEEEEVVLDRGGGEERGIAG